MPNKKFIRLKKYMSDNYSIVNIEEIAFIMDHEDENLTKVYLKDERIIATDYTCLDIEEIISKSCF